MFEEIKYGDSNSEVNEGLKKAFIEQMTRGYQEMGELNLKISKEMHHLESEADNTVSEILKNKS